MLIFHFNWLPWQQSIDGSQKATNPEILVKIDSLYSEKQPVENRLLKKLKIKEKIKKKYWQNI